MARWWEPEEEYGETTNLPCLFLTIHAVIRDGLATSTFEQFACRSSLAPVARPRFGRSHLFQPREPSLSRRRMSAEKGRRLVDERLTSEYSLWRRANRSLRSPSQSLGGETGNPPGGEGPPTMSLHNISLSLAWPYNSTKAVSIPLQPSFQSFD